MEIMSINNKKEKVYTTAKRLERLSSSDLHIDSDYQRPLSMTRVGRICANFNEHLVNLIKVSHRDGKYYVFDGQHTRAALEKMNNDKPVMVDVMIYEFVGLSSKEQKEIEAELFSLQTGDYSSISCALRFRALLESKNPSVMRFHSITNSTGVLMDFTGGNHDHKLTCIKEAWNSWHSLGNSLYVDMLTLILQIWGGDRVSLRSPIVGAMSRFVKAYHDKYDRSILIDCLSGVPPQDIIDAGAKSPEASKFKYMREVLRLYNEEAAKRMSCSA
jgi:hypothetical protein